MQFYSPQCQVILQNIGLDHFDAVWDAQLEMVDQPNQARGGWSETGFYRFENAEHSVKTLYIKRQQNFIARSFRHPFSGQLTFENEYNILLHCISMNIPVVQPVAFATRHYQGLRQAILMTAGLHNYISMDHHKVIEKMNIPHRRKVIHAVADVVRRLHQSDIQHGCLYPKHILVSRDSLSGKVSDIDVRLLDFEKASRLSYWNKGIYRDLDTLHRRSYDWNNRDRWYFLMAYSQQDKSAIYRIVSRLLE